MVPHEVLHHVEGFVPVEAATYTSLLFRTEQDTEYIQEIRELGINPAKLLAKLRLRERHRRNIMESKEYPLTEYLNSCDPDWMLRKHPEYPEFSLAVGSGCPPDVLRKVALDAGVRLSSWVSFDPDLQKNLYLFVPVHPWGDEPDENEDAYYEMENIETLLLVDRFLEADRVYRKVHELPRHLRLREG